MLEGLAAVVAVLVAFWVGKRQGRVDERIKGYDSTAGRINSVTRAPDSDVADRLRRHGL